MNIESINGLSSVTTAELTSVSGSTKTNQDFSAWLQQEINSANTQINEADMKLREFAVGKTDNLHQVMMSLEKAKTSFEMVVQIRNRLLEGYQEIMRMQI